MIRYLVPGRDKAANELIKRVYDEALDRVADHAFQITQEKCGWSDEDKDRIRARLKAIPGVYGAAEVLEIVAGLVGEEVDAKAKPKPNGGAS